jgi:hypothetical protein
MRSSELRVGARGELLRGEPTACELHGHAARQLDPSVRAAPFHVRQRSLLQVAALARANNGGIDETKPFAELWWVNSPCAMRSACMPACTPRVHPRLSSSRRMGTHSNCPSVVSASGDSLQAWIEAHPESLGSAVTRRFGTHLPFLFKVLSVRKALSIQSHPDKALAERLHAEHPKVRRKQEQ